MRMGEMKLTMIVLCLMILTSCRGKSSDNEITKPQLREQLKNLQALKNNDYKSQLSVRTNEEKEVIALQILSVLDEETLEKLSEHPRFKELFINKAKNDQALIKEKLQEIKTLEEEIERDLGIRVKRNVGALKNIFFLPTKNPYLQYSVHSKRGAASTCDELERTHTYWEELLSLKKNPSLLLGMSNDVFEQSIKSCLLFYRLSGTIEKCQFPYEVELEELCRF